MKISKASAVSSPYVKYFKTSLLSVAVFISHYSTVITNITFSPSAQSYCHTVALHADTQQCLLLLNTYTFACWVTGSLHHIVPGIIFSSLVNDSMICVPMRSECWKRQGSLMQTMTVCLPQLKRYRCHTQLYASLSCGPWQSVSHNWTATDVTHSCMPVSHAAHDSLLATTEQLQMPHTAVCQSLMQPMTVSLPQLNSYRCHTQLYVRMWNYLSSCSKLVDLCVDFLYVVSEDESLMSGGF